MNGSIAVRRITTGVVRTRRARRGLARYVGDDWSSDALPVNAYLVEHPGGRLLFDTGQTAAAAADGYFGLHPFLRLSRFELDPADEVAEQLDRFGIAPDSIDHVVLSHLHTDHAGGLAPFRTAEVLVSEVEWRRATGLGGVLRGYVPYHWPPALQPVLVGPGGPRLGPFAWTHDVTGDGSLLVVPTPGHTTGHVSLVVRGHGRTWLLAGDAAHDKHELEQRHPDIARWCAAAEALVLTAHDVAER